MMAFAAAATSGDDVLRGNDNDNTIRGEDGNDTIFGRGGNDTLYGDDGNDTLYGGAGGDRLEGGAGNDTYVNVLGDIVFEALDGGIDQVNSSVDLILGANLENLLLTGSDSLNGIG